MKPTFRKLICAFTLLAAPIAHAADRVHPTSGDDLHDGHLHNHGPLPKTSLLPGFTAKFVDFCGTDLTSDEAKETMRLIKAQREAGLPPLANKNRIIPTIGDRQTFNALAGNFSVSDGTVWTPFEFELVDITTEYYLWVEVTQLADGNVSPTDVVRLRGAMFDSTPSRSINPNQGIVANINQTFGQPPDIDGDGIVDILMYDISPGQGGTLGFVSGADQLIGAGSGNERDILYLDSNEGVRNFTTLAVIAAHEYTHLIHLTYGFDTTFITEGMAEYAMVMNGYYWRGVGYISSISEVSLPLFSWRTSPNGGPGARDYERGGLFFTYIAEQFGPDVVGEMMRDTEKKGAIGLDSVLATRGSTLSDVMLDFHTANHVNDKSVDSRFGYNEPERSSHHTFLTSPPVDGEVESSVGEGGFSFQFAERVEPGSVHYLRLSNVADVDLVYDTPDPTGLFKPSYWLRNRGRVLMRSEDGTTSSVDIRPGTQNVRLDGNFSAVTFILIHDNPNLPRGDVSSIEAFWTPLSLATDVKDAVEVPQDIAISEAWPNPFRNALHLDVALQNTERVRVDLVDMMGRTVSRLIDGVLPAGTNSLRLDAVDMPSGMYLVRVVTRDQVVTRSVVRVN